MKNRLFIQIALTFLVLTIILGGCMAYISVFSAQNYYEEANQKLNAQLAQYTADHITTFNENNEIDTNGIQDIMHSMMVINPDVEVYLIDNNGNILTHVAPYKKVVRETVDLTPIKSFVEAEGNIFIKGDDPRDLGGQKVFSAAPIMDGSNVRAYYYIILASEERASVLQAHTGSLAMQLGCQLIVLAVVGSLLLGLLAFYLLTKSLTNITEAVHSFKDGNYSSRIQGAGTGSFGIIGSTFNDMARQIELNIEKIKSIDTFRKELIANISHDLRTPLAIIQGFTETLILKKDSLKKKESDKYLDHINESAKRLSGLVNQLFELSKLENNQIKLNKEPFHLDELIQDLLDRYEVLARDKNIKFTFSRDESLPLAYGDISLVERLLQNLVDNALKFTPDNGEVTIELIKEEGKILFRITDTGKGIEEKNLTKIFDRYTSGKKEEQKEKGAGLGLAIAKKIIEMHDSTINVSSRLDVGTSFSFFFPSYQN